LRFRLLPSVNDRCGSVDAFAEDFVSGVVLTGSPKVPQRQRGFRGVG
jgi:hypothetical protein